MTFKPVHVPCHLYFITATLVGWKPLLREDAYAKIVLNSMDWLRREKRWFLFAFCLMPTHLHAIVKPMVERTISQVIQNFGSFTAHEILKHLESERRNELVEFFHQAQTHPQKEHRIWQKIQAQNIYSENFLKQKLEYIHNNPVSKKWMLADERANYRYSSAGYYDRGEKPMIEIDDVWEYFEKSEETTRGRV
ncbi:MAG: transposase [Chloroflexi bacterium]|nr:transposase [Chloroflexota bacterium]